jgi:hypothetical protein
MMHNYQVAELLTVALFLKTISTYIQYIQYIVHFVVLLSPTASQERGEERRGNITCAGMMCALHFFKNNMF